MHHLRSHIVRLVRYVSNGLSEPWKDDYTPPCCRMVLRANTRIAWDLDFDARIECGGVVGLPVGWVQGRWRTRWRISAWAGRRGGPRRARPSPYPGQPPRRHPRCYVGSDDRCRESIGWAKPESMGRSACGSGRFGSGHSRVKEWRQRRETVFGVRRVMGGRRIRKSRRLPRVESSCLEWAHSNR